MATDEDKTEGGTGAEGGEGRGASARSRGTGRNRGERPAAGRGGAPSDRDVSRTVADLGNMDPQRAAAILSALQARASAGGTSNTPKISRALDELDAEAAENVIAACDEALDLYDEAEQKKDKTFTDAKALAPIREASPEVEAAIITNSSYRHKPVKYSVEVTRRYLEHKHGADAEPEQPQA